MAIWSFWAPMLQLLAVDRCRSHLADLLSSWTSSIIPNLRWNSDAFRPNSRDVIISGSGGHIDISGCLSLLYSHANNIFHLHVYMVLNIRFAVGILAVPHIVSEI